MEHTTEIEHIQQIQRQSNKGCLLGKCVIYI